MRRILAIISDEDRDMGIALISIVATYNTLLEIDGYELDTEEIKKRIICAQKDLTAYWDYLSDKYMFPLYLNKTMKISNESNTIYVED